MKRTAFASTVEKKVIETTALLKAIWSSLVFCCNRTHLHAADPEFASVNLGVFVCYECATVHRRLGNTVSQVKSLRIDTWTEEMFKVSILLVNEIHFRQTVRKYSDIVFAY